MQVPKTSFHLTWILLCAGALPARAQLTQLFTFDPSQAGGLCGLGVDPVTDSVWVYDCSAATLQEYSPAGVFLSEVARPGGSADDVDIEFAPRSLVLGATTVPEGTLLFIDGESGPAEIYAVDKTSGSVLATLNTAFGASHVVGGGYHPIRQTFFLVQDSVPGGPNGNLVGEVDPQTGAVLNTFQTSPAGFSVFFGDLDVARSGNLLLVSSSESTLAEFTPDGVFVQELSLPSGVASLSGIGVTGDGAQAWVGGTGGRVWRLGGLPGCLATTYCTAGTTTGGCNATMSASGTASLSNAAPFTLTASGVDGNKNGIIFYSIAGQNSAPWGNSQSFLCVKSPTQRMNPPAGSGGTNGLCDGSYSRDWNAYVAANPGKAINQALVVGSVVGAQSWFRDGGTTGPIGAKGTALSNAIEFSVCP